LAAVSDAIFDAITNDHTALADLSSTHAATPDHTPGAVRVRAAWKPARRAGPPDRVRGDRGPRNPTDAVASTDAVVVDVFQAA
jgi:hypothetical protein